jgi:hypothetical protein
MLVDIILPLCHTSTLQFKDEHYVLWAVFTFFVKFFLLKISKLRHYYKSIIIFGFIAPNAMDLIS